MARSRLPSATRAAWVCEGSTQASMETRDLGPGWVGADFSFTDREPIGLNLTVVARHTAEGWRFAHYHVSPRP